MKALFAGTFDPPTLGHLNLIQRACALFETVYVGIATNPEKKNRSPFTLAETTEMLTAITSSLKGVKIVPIEGLVIQFAKQNKVDCFIRGLRAAADHEHEWGMAVANRQLSGIDTLFLMADDRYAHLSSSLIRELASYGASLSQFVPKEIEQKVLQKLKKN
jgi:pantetheine-phosphate adenylyltransferase